jgi:hypothetical protein
VTRRGAIGLLGGVASLLLAGCGVAGGRSSYRFRMTIEVETPAGLKVGSSVMEVSAERQVSLTSETHPVSAGLSGEAVEVDLPGGPFFALLTIRDGGPQLFQAVSNALSPLETATPGVEDYMAQTEKLGSKWIGSYTADLPREAWPMMVRFRNPSDPKTVEQVDPAAIGVKRIGLETVSEAVTTGIENRLGWLSSHRGALVRSPPGDMSVVMPFGYLITEGDFSTELTNGK